MRNEEYTVLPTHTNLVLFLTPVFSFLLCWFVVNFLYNFII